MGDRSFGRTQLRAADLVLGVRTPRKPGAHADSWENIDGHVRRPQRYGPLLAIAVYTGMRIREILGLVREEGTLCPWASVLCLGVRAPADRGGDGRGSEKRAERSEHPCDLGLLPLSGDLLW